VPIKHAAAPTDLSLPTHAVDTFTGWTPPPSINLIIAVSFGLFVPPRILNQAKYGGLNVHPSLLPDLPGPAPIEHAILKGRRTTGITIQTLDPEHFDQGTILAQSSVPVRHDHTAAELHKQLETAGAKELVHVLQTRKFVPPLDDARLPSGSGPMEYARKLTKQDRFIDLAKSTLGEILAITRALGPPWCFLPNGRRLQLLEIQHVKEMNGDHDAPGFFVDKDTRQIVMRAACGSVARLVKSTYEGGAAGLGNREVEKLLRAGRL
jgi:methionyl-tRNA formyltransferase